MRLAEELEKVNNPQAKADLDLYVRVARKLDNIKKVRIQLKLVYENIVIFLNQMQGWDILSNVNEEVPKKEQIKREDIPFKEITETTFSDWISMNILKKDIFTVEELIHKWLKKTLAFSKLGWIKHKIKYWMSYEYRLWVTAKAADYLSNLMSGQAFQENIIIPLKNELKTRKDKLLSYSEYMIAPAVSNKKTHIEDCFGTVARAKADIRIGHDEYCGI